MTNLQTVFDTLDHLKPDELADVSAYIKQLRAETTQVDDPEEKIALLMEALAEFRDGLSDVELQAIVEAMNVEYTHSMKDLGMYDWLDEDETAT